MTHTPTEEDNYPKFHVFVTPSCKHPSRPVPEYQTAFIRQLLEAGYTPLVDSQPISYAMQNNIVHETGLVYYDDMSVVPCVDYDGRRPLALQTYLYPLSKIDLLTIARYMSNGLMDKDTEKLAIQGCFHGVPPNVMPLVKSEFIGNNVICE